MTFSMSNPEHKRDQPLLATASHRHHSVVYQQNRIFNFFIWIYINDKLKEKW